jgi:long-chain acyl-CoA synthetase
MIESPGRFIKPMRWLSNYDPGVPHSIEYPVVPVYRPLMDSASRYPDSAALLIGGATVTFAELRARVEAFAAALCGLGAGIGNRIGVCLANCPEIVISYYGAMRAGAAPVMLSPTLVDRELSHTIADAGFKTLVCQEESWYRLHSVPREGGLETVILAGGQPTATPSVDGPSIHVFDRLVENTDPPPEEPDIDPRADVAVLIYTGGTTGLPKAVELTHYSVVANAMQLGAWVEYGEGDAVLAALPLFHSYGMSAGMNAPLFKGAASVLLRGEGIGELIESVQAARPKVFIGVPATIAALAEHPVSRRPTCRHSNTASWGRLPCRAM